MKLSDFTWGDWFKLILVMFIVSGSITLFSGFFVYSGIMDAIFAFESRNWPETDGTVVESRVKVTESSTKSSSNKKTTDYSTEYSYIAIIKYRYLVDEKPFIGDRIKFGEVTNQGIAEEFVARYPKHTKVRVYYKPDDASMAVLEPGFSWGLLFFPLLGLVFMAVGLVLGILIWWLREDVIETIDSLLTGSFLLRVVATIVGILLLCWLLVYLLFKFLYPEG